MRYVAALLLLLVTLVATLAMHHARDGIETAPASLAASTSVMEDAVPSFAEPPPTDSVAAGLVGFEAATMIDALAGVCAAILVCCMIALLALRLRMRTGLSIGLSERLKLLRFDAPDGLRASVAPSLITLSISRV